MSGPQHHLNTRTSGCFHCLEVYRHNGSSPSLGCLLKMLTFFRPARRGSPRWGLFLNYLIKLILLISNKSEIGECFQIRWCLEEADFSPGGVCVALSLHEVMRGTTWLERPCLLWGDCWVFYRRVVHVDWCSWDYCCILPRSGHTLAGCLPPPCQAQVDSAIYLIFKWVKSIITPEDIYMFVLSVSYHSWKCVCLGFFIRKIIFILWRSTEQNWLGNNEVKLFEKVSNIQESLSISVCKLTES